MSRVKTAFVSGTITNNPLAIGGTTLNSAELSSLAAIAAPDIAVIILDPAGTAGAPEIVWVTEHTALATSATITRACEGTTARQHASGIPWVHGPTIKDVEEEYIYSIERELEGDALFRNVSILRPAGSVALDTTKMIGIGWYGTASGANPNYYGQTLDGSLQQMDTSATISSYIIAHGCSMYASYDPTLIFRGCIPDEANRDIFIGFSADAALVVAAANNRIGFQIASSGNIIGVSDSGGTETQRDTGAVPSGGTTLVTLKVVISDGGTIVRFYKDGTQVGADVTTNIPSARLWPMVGIANTAAALKYMRFQGIAYWREA